MIKERKKERKKERNFGVRKERRKGIWKQGKVGWKKGKEGTKEEMMEVRGGKKLAKKKEENGK